MAISGETKLLIQSLTAANSEIVAEAGRATDSILAGMKRHESKAFERIASLLSEAPRFGDTNLQARLAWHFENIASNEVQQARFAKSVRSYLDRYPRLGSLAEKVLRAGRVPKELSFIPREVIDILRSRDFAFFEGLNRQAMLRLNQSLLDSVIIGRTPAGALADIKGVITGSYPWGKRRGLYEWHAGTYARTANLRYAREVIAQKTAELGIETFLYVGPIDNKTRPFCQSIVGTTHTRLEIEELDNGQTGDVMSDGGGFNCRHTWTPVPSDVFNELRQPGAETELEKEATKKAPRRNRPKAEDKPPTPSLLGEKAWLRSISNEESGAFNSWKSTAYPGIRKYQYLNSDAFSAWASSPGRGPNYYRRLTEAIEAALNRAKPYKGTVWRGMYNLPDGTYQRFLNAKEISWNALSSSSKNPLQVEGFARSSGNNLIFRIKNKSGIDITNVAGQTDEAEVLLRKGARYRVTGKEKSWLFERETWRIDLEEI